MATTALFVLGWPSPRSTMAASDGEHGVSYPCARLTAGCQNLM